ncbi:hypothetical protein Hanom_Chr07g00603261 [Helianthus anomalus]
MIFHAPDVIEKEELPIPKSASLASCFPHLWWIYGRAPARVWRAILVRADQRSLLYPPARAFANPHTATEDAHLPNPRPLRDVTSGGKEILYLSSEESVGSLNGELSSWSNIFAGVLRDLGIDPEEKKKKRNKKKKVITINASPRSMTGRSSRTTAGSSDKGTL